MIKLKRKCPVCGCNQGEEILYHMSMMLPTDYPITGEYDVVCCSLCGFLYADIDDTQTSYNEYYEKCNSYSCYSKLKQDIYDRNNRLKVDFLEKYLNKGDKILDIGCGGGGLLKELKKRGFCNLYGIDPSSQSVKSLWQDGIEGSIGNIFDKVQDDLKEKFDVVCCIAVLEHLYAIKIAIENIRRYLKPNGKIFIMVPAAEGFEKYKANLPNYFNHEHINYFSLQSLDNLFVNIGFKRINENIDSYYEFASNGIVTELVIRGIYQYQGTNIEMIRDDSTVESVRRYFQSVELEIDERKEILRHLIAQKKKIVIWGTGAYTQWILHAIPEITDSIECFVDNNTQKQGTVFCDKPIYGADFLMDSYIGREAVIVICSMQNAQDIAEQINNMNMNYEYLILK